MNFKRHRAKKQRAGCDCGGKVFKRYKRRGLARSEQRLARENLREVQS